MAEQEIPKQMKVCHLEEFGKPIESKTIDVPQPKEGELLIKVHGAPINPADLFYNMGGYPIDKKPPTVPGLEGSGVVVAGNGKVESTWVGKRVAFLPTDPSYGTFGEYSISNVNYAMIIPEEISLDVAASSFVNPVTVLCMLETVQQAKVKAVIHTAAASQLGRMFVKYFQNNGVEVINVVRRQEQVDLLKSEAIGAKHVLNQTDENFDAQLKELSAELGATIAFDAISGEITGRILAQMPKKSTIYVYGGLSGGNPEGLSLVSLLFEGKTAGGYWLMRELGARKPEQVGALFAKVPSMLDKDFVTTVQKTFNHDAFNEAVEFYQANQTGGKVLITPQ